jgi:glucose-6-phosphate 1-epimerase
MPFTAALHTYFTISDVTKFHITGLQGITYTDSLQDGKQIVEAAEQLRVDREVDRIYLQAPDMDVKVWAMPAAVVSG